MTITLSADAFYTAFKVIVGLILLGCFLEIVVGYFYDHYCGDKSTKEYKERMKNEKEAS